MQEPSTPGPDPLPGITPKNPYQLTGVATPGHVVRLYVGGIVQQEVKADQNDGSFQLPIILEDEVNQFSLTYLTRVLPPSSSVLSTRMRSLVRKAVQVQLSRGRDGVWRMNGF